MKAFLVKLREKLEYFRARPSSPFFTRIKRSRIAFIVIFGAISAFVFLIFETGSIIWLIAALHSFFFILFLGGEGRKAVSSAGYDEPLSSVLGKATRLLEDNGFKILSRSGDGLKAFRGVVAANSLGEKQWRDLRLHVEVRADRENERTMLRVSCFYASLVPWFASGDKIKEAISGTSSAISALDSEKLKALDAVILFREGSWLFMGGIATRIYIALFACAILTFGALIGYSVFQRNETRELLNRTNLYDRMYFAHRACFGRIDRKLKSEALRAEKFIASREKRNVRDLPGLREMLKSAGFPRKLASLPLHAGALDENGKVHFVTDAPGITLEDEAVGSMKFVTRGFEKGVFRGVIIPLPWENSSKTKAIVLGVFPDFYYLKQYVPEGMSSMEFTVWHEGKSILKITWQKRDKFSVGKGSAVLPDEVVTSVLEGVRRKSLFGLEFFRYALFPSRQDREDGGLHEMFRKETRGKTPYRAIYSLRRKGDSFGLHGVSLVLSQHELDGLPGVVEFEFASIMSLMVLILAGCFFAVFVSIIGIFLSKRISRPILRVRDALGSIALGDFSVRVETGKRADEIGQLERSVNTVAIELERREAIKELMGKYMSRQVAEKVLKEGGSASLAGVRKEVSILFADVRGFTGFSEKHSAEEVTKTLNEYFEVMVDVIAAHEGVLDKFMGDGLMVVFGAPYDQPDHARRAVITALEMQAALQSLNLKRAQKGAERIDIGIGVNTGTAISGNLGSLKRMEFTVVGDSVNTASRLESTAKKGQILLGRNTFEKVKNFIEFEPVGKVQVKGKKDPIDVWLATGLKPA